MYLYSRIIHCTWVYPPDYYPPFFGYYFFNLMLVILLMLHIFWAYLILRMVKMFLFGSVSWSTFTFGNVLCLNSCWCNRFVPFLTPFILKYTYQIFDNSFWVDIFWDFICKPWVIYFFQMYAVNNICQIGYCMWFVSICLCICVNVDINPLKHCTNMD